MTQPEGEVTLDEGADQAFQRAQRVVMTRGDSCLDTEHLLLGLLDDPRVKERLEALGLNPRRIRSATNFLMGEPESQFSQPQMERKPQWSDLVRKAVVAAGNEARLWNVMEQASSVTLLRRLVLLEEGRACRILESFGLWEESIDKKIPPSFMIP